MKYITVEDLLALHEEALLAHGGGRGFRDPQGLSALESIVNSQYPVFGHEPYRGIFHKVANIFYLINKDHVFADGNKRTALLAAMVMLGKNGYEFIALEDLAEEFTLDVAAVDTHTPGFEKDEYITYIARWLARNSKQIKKVQRMGRVYRITKWLGPQRVQ